MDIHKPKPVHGWREFLKEYGIILLSVLTALAMEQTVEEWRWRSKVAEARQELRYEVGFNLTVLDKRLSETGCVDKRLDELGLIVGTAAKTGRLPPVGRIGWAVWGTYPTTVWQSQVSAQTATHFSAVELGSIGRIYRYMELLHETSRDENLAWRTMASIVGPGRTIDASTAQQLIGAMVVIRRANRSYPAVKQYILGIETQSGLGRDFAQLDPKNRPMAMSLKDSICEPIGAEAPAGYGMAEIN
jgi:hypothetical protein